MIAFAEEIRLCSIGLQCHLQASFVAYSWSSEARKLAEQTSCISSASSAFNAQGNSEARTYFLRVDNLSRSLPWSRYRIRNQLALCTRIGRPCPDRDLHDLIRAVPGIVHCFASLHLRKPLLGIVTPDAISVWRVVSLSSPVSTGVREIDFESISGVPETSSGCSF